LTLWSLVIRPEAAPLLRTGRTPTTRSTDDFEAGDCGFAHSGAADERPSRLPTPWEGWYDHAAAELPAGRREEA